MLLFLSICGAFLSILLLYFNGRKYPASVFLGIFFFLISLYAFGQYALIYSHSVDLVQYTFIYLGIPTYLVGPSFYFYIRNLLNDRSMLARKDLWHLAPMIVYILLTLPYFAMPWSTKKEIITLLAESFENLKYVNFFPAFSSPFKTVIYLSRPILVFAYFSWSLVLFLNYIRRHSTNAVFSGQRFMVKWVGTLFISFLILITSHLIGIWISLNNQSTHIFFTTNILQILSGLGLISLLVSPFFFPQILYGLPRISQPATSPSTANKGSDIENHNVTGASRPGFEAEYLQAIENKAEMYMREAQPYLQEGLNLINFSKLTLLPAHHLSYYFKEVRKQSFNDYKNEWRVNHASNLMQQGRHVELTIEAVGLVSGFSSRDTFFRSFKKFKGMTPGEYAAGLNMQEN